MLIYLVFLIFFIGLYMKLYFIKKKLKVSESYNNSLSTSYDNVRGFKHDFDTIINTIGGYIKLNDMEGLKKYYSSLKTDCTDIKNVQILNPYTINNPGIYSLIVSEYEKASKNNVKINFEFLFDFKKLHMPVYEFSRILGILIDNAIDAAKECDDRQINLSFIDSSRNRAQIITIENTYWDKDVDTNKIFIKGISGKRAHSGIGLWEVKQIVKRHDNVALNTSKDDVFFKQQLEIYY